MPFTVRIYTNERYEVLIGKSVNLFILQRGLQMVFNKGITWFKVQK